MKLQQEHAHEADFWKHNTPPFRSSRINLVYGRTETRTSQVWKLESSRAMALGRGAEIPVNPHVSKFGVGISWDKGPKAVDVDLQAVIVDDKGVIIDAVYYNNMKALRCITHSGDEQTGERAGLDETIWITMPRIPQQVKSVIFVVAAHNRGHLRDVSNGVIHVLEDTMQNEVASYRMEESPHEVDAVLMMVKSDQGDWNLRVLDSPAQPGRHFMDILEPTLGNLIRGILPGAPKRQKVAFAMEKGAVVDLPQASSLGIVTAGLGWDVARGSDIDLDVSVVFFGKDFQEVGAVFFGNTEQFGVQHSGDNLTGEGSGDDEVIKVNLAKIPDTVAQMIFSVNIYTPNVTFDQVANAYCRVCSEDGSELARYVLREARGETGLLIARLFREPGDRWGFQAIGNFCRGRTYKDSLRDMAPLVRQSARDIQKISMASTVEWGGSASSAPRGSHERPIIATVVEPVKKPNECCLQ